MGTDMKLDMHPLVERFTLRGVHGYKDITIDFSGPATVVVAENGTGKTTVLSALNAFLTRRFHRLVALPFENLECKFRGISNPITVVRSSIGPGIESTPEVLRTTAQKAGITEDELIDFIQREYTPKNFERLRGHRILHQVYMNTPGDFKEAKALLDSLYLQHQTSLSDGTKVVARQLHDILAGVEVVYLPTYRRIERPLLRTRRRETPHLINPYAKKSEADYTYEGIAFGLGDIEARLAELSEEIERASNLGYRTSSARILNDMLQGASKLSFISPDLPDVRSLRLFLGRVGRVENNLTYLFENIDALYESREIFKDEYSVLRYFLGQLNAVIVQTKSLEQKIEQFVEVCNGYLTMSSDEKRLAFDPGTLKVVVQNLWADCTVPLDSLSSGEKQIISLMAKLYLYEGSKFVLIDEPELSLSLEWQRKVLPDVLRSGSVVQMLAITHSPFIFENELDRFAAGLQMSRSKPGAAHVAD